MALLRPAKRVRAGMRLQVLEPSGLETNLGATVIEKGSDGIGRLHFDDTADLRAEIARLGEVPLPPYIRRDDAGPTVEDRERYQTVYARHDGSVAAPTAGLHFTESLLGRLQECGVELCFVTLHVGLATFMPVKVEDIRSHRLPAEHYRVSAEAARAIQGARSTRRRIVAVGTTTVRVLEHLANEGGGSITAGAGSTRLFIHPPFEFRVVQGLITNFHLPRSTLLMLVSSFAAPGLLTGREMILKAYTTAIESGYRFYSYGDAMFIC
jgi:S-adenosylmethionine:tRNA ribosyltransferase-isomerase